MFSWCAVIIIFTTAVDVSRGHLCIQEPRQRLNVTGYNDYYSDCYYYHGPCGDTFDRAPPYPTIVKAGSELMVKFSTPVTHYTRGKKGYFQVNLRAAKSDQFVELTKVPDADGLYHNLPVKFPDICSDLIFVADDSHSSRDIDFIKDTSSSTNEKPGTAGPKSYMMAQSTSGSHTEAAGKDIPVSTNEKPRTAAPPPSMMAQTTATFPGSHKKATGEDISGSTNEKPVMSTPASYLMGQTTTSHYNNYKGVKNGTAREIPCIIFSILITFRASIELNL
ncbi:hypothetical protein ElyMa_004029400 [Elysia marginata]|uniref:CUB domain-containing protein n=1 Tax=Elysia marginata TaxID=1093978 RepID=A0AAV4G5G6_9GAST|nr:hypothetical protein ElyMa_004029400 [Elysia marginata]